MKRILFTIVFFVVLLSFDNVYATSVQIADENQIKDILSQNGITIENLTLSGDSKQFGQFEGFSGEIVGFNNLDSGIFLTIGNCEQNIFGEERPTFISTSLNGTYMNASDLGGYSSQNDAELQSAVTYGGKLYDVAYIEFDATSDTEYISFQYVFASEEFDQAPMFNDLFVLYADGTNIAVVEELEEWERDINVSMMSVKNTEFHYDNIHGTNFGFLGYTTLLSCQVNTTPGEKVHFKLAIGDLSDPIYDSAAFISAFSNQPAPPHETNPNPSTRELINFSKNISAIKLTLADGQVLTDAQIDGGIVKGAKQNILDLEDYYLIVDEEIIHGATLEIEYLFEFENTTYTPFKDFLITDNLDEKFKYKDDQKLLTSNKTNNQEGWYLDNDKLKNEYNHELQQNVKNQIKLVLSTTITHNDQTDWIYTNSAKGKIDITKGNMTGKLILNAKAEEVRLIPPFGMDAVMILGMIVISLMSISIVYLTRR